VSATTPLATAYDGDRDVAGTRPSALRIVAPFGFYGWGNIGDESTLQGFAALVKRSGLSSSVWVASRNQAHTARVEPSFRYFGAERGGLLNRVARRWANHRASAAVFAGGTPIMDGLGEWPLNEVTPLVRHARQANKPVAFVGVGTEKLQRVDSRDLFAKELAPAVAHWSVRSERDKERLLSWGVGSNRVTVAADMAWLLRQQSAEFGQRTLRALNVSLDQPLIAVNVNNEDVVLQREPKLFETLAECLDTQIESRGARVLFICSEVRDEPSFDKATAQRVLGLMKRRDRAAILPNHYWTPQELLSLIACCHSVISMRYHVCLFSAVQGVPFLAIQRSDKVRDLCTDIDWPFGLTLGSVHLPALLDQMTAIDLRSRQLSEQLLRASEERGRASQRNQVALEALADALRVREAQERVR
jgi:polysaccharide pyruvyl transferase WcaK-like protein